MITLSSFQQVQSILVTPVKGILPSISGIPFNFSLDNGKFKSTSIGFYMVTANFLYLSRRSHLRNMSKRNLLRIRTSREDGVTWGLFFVTLAVWQVFVALFPLVEMVARVFGMVSFFYSYPNAAGLGFILEPLSVQDQKMNKRVKHQIRLDWHRFNVNIGDIGRDGYRHPPYVEKNLPHIDMPSRGLRHWPWRRRHDIPNLSKNQNGER